jgi:hypothetical protein
MSDVLRGSSYFHKTYSDIQQLGDNRFIFSSPGYSRFQYKNNWKHFSDIRKKCPFFEGSKFLPICLYSSSITIQMGIDHWWKDTDRVKLNYSE